jgi:hypothetical protein
MVQSLFSERDAFGTRKTSLFTSFTSLIGMEWIKAFLVGMDLSNMAQFFKFFYEKYLKKFLALPALPSNEKNSFDCHNSWH